MMRGSCLNSKNCSLKFTPTKPGEDRRGVSGGVDDERDMGMHGDEPRWNVTRECERWGGDGRDSDNTCEGSTRLDGTL